MLPFGSITSIVPLSVLAIAYALFVCASALNRIKPESDTPPVKEIIVKAGAIDPSHKTSVDYSDIPYLCNRANDNQPHKSPEWFCFSLIDLPAEPEYSGYTNFLFSRPPPLLS